MSFGAGLYAGPCSNPCTVQCPQPLATSSNEPCVVSCPASRVIIFPPPVVVTFPGPILTTCPQETVVGSSAVQDGCASASLASVGAEFLHSEPSVERSIPRPMSQCTPKCSYLFDSHWVHPCNRASYRGYQPSDNEKEEHTAEKEKPETENIDAANEDAETSEV